MEILNAEIGIRKVTNPFTVMSTYTTSIFLQVCLVPTMYGLFVNSSLALWSGFPGPVYGRDGQKSDCHRVAKQGPCYSG